MTTEDRSTAHLFGSRFAYFCATAGCGRPRDIGELCEVCEEESMKTETTICEMCEVRLPESEMEYTNDGYMCKKCIEGAREEFFRHWRLLKAGELIQEGDEWSDEEDWGPTSRAGTVVTLSEEGNYRRRITQPSPN